MWEASAVAAVVLAGALAATAHAAAGRGAWRVVLAVVRRDLLHAASYRLRLLFIAVNAAAFLLIALLVGRSFLFPALAPVLSGAARNAVVYLVIGAFAWPVAWVGYQASASVVRQEQFLGTLETTVATPVGLAVVPFARFVVQVVVAALGAVAMLAVGLVFVLPVLDGGFHAELLAVGVVALLLAALFLWGIGLLFAGLAAFYKDVGPAAGVLRYGLIILSGVYVPLEVLPPALAAGGRAFPLATAFDLVRASFGASIDPWDVSLKLSLLAGSALLAVALGLRALRAGVDAARRAGAVSGY